MRALFRFLVSPTYHLIMCNVWLLLTIPTLLWWKTSVEFVILLSLYANLIGQWGAYQGARAERASRRNQALDS